MTNTKAMINIYNVIFFKLYKTSLKTANKDIAEWTTMIAMSILIFFNITSVIVLTKIYKTGIFNVHSMPIIMIVLLIINYLLFIRDKKYLKIAKEYSKISELKNKILGYIVLFYVIGSIWLFFHIIEAYKPYI